jgi:D-arabinitol dehydrogenase (NADP+)
MNKMRALVYEKPGNGGIQEVPMPSCGEDDVVIKVVSASICRGADRRHHTTGHALGRYPITTGHEFSGYVYEVGKNVTRCKEGDRVTADNTVPCGNCYYCRINKPMQCNHFGSIGHNIPGGFAQYLKVRESAIYLIPDNLSFNEACLTEPVACCIHAMDRLDVKYGEDVLVFGAGSNGLVLSQMIKHSNAEKVVTLASTQSKLDILNGYGIETQLINRDDFSIHEKAIHEKFPQGVNAVVDATGSASILENSIQFLRKCGRLLQYSSPPDDAKFTISPAYFYRNELQYYTSFCQTHNFGRALAAMGSGKVKVDKIITAAYPLDDFFIAIEDVVKRNVLKLIIHPNGYPI